MVIPQVNAENGRMTVTLRETVKACDPFDWSDTWPVDVTALEPGHVRMIARGTQLDIYTHPTENGTLISIPAYHRCGIVPNMTGRDVLHALQLDSQADAASIAAAVKWGESQ